MAEWTRAKDCSANSCIEVRGFADGRVGIRNTKNGFAIFNSTDEWVTFAAGVKAGDFNHIGKADPA
jgi:hypothetical protein